MLDHEGNFGALKSNPYRNNSGRGEEDASYRDCNSSSADAADRKEVSLDLSELECTTASARLTVLEWQYSFRHQFFPLTMG
jgi:hypothetical protein